MFLEENKDFQYIDPKTHIDGYYIIGVRSLTYNNQSYYDLYITKFDEETGKWFPGGKYYSTFLSREELDLYIETMFIVKYHENICNPEQLLPN